jgi:hypothetical protein
MSLPTVCARKTLALVDILSWFEPNLTCFGAAVIPFAIAGRAFEHPLPGDRFYGWQHYQAS